VVWKPLSPEGISREYPFFAKLPAWVPVGYTLQDQAALYYTSTIETPPFSALFQWKDENGGWIQLEIMNGSCLNGQFHNSDDGFQDRRSDCTLAMYITVESERQLDVTTVHDQPAVFFYGNLMIADLSGASQTWNPSRWLYASDETTGMTMIWENDGRTYSLVTEAAKLTKEDMLRLAESIP
jgi:hypothetical protein